jgi:hypothetical protein
VPGSARPSSPGPWSDYASRRSVRCRGAVRGGSSLWPGRRVTIDAGERRELGVEQAEDMPPHLFVAGRVVAAGRTLGHHDQVEVDGVEADPPAGARLQDERCV